MVIKVKRANFIRLHNNFPSAASKNNVFHFKNCHNITSGFLKYYRIIFLL